MQSKTSFFSRTIFFNQLKRFWPLYASYLAIWLLIVPIPLISALRDAQLQGWDMEGDAVNHIAYTGFYGGALMSIVFCAFFAMAAFYYLYNNRHVSQMGSLPVKREGTFLSVYLPGLAVMLGTHLVVYLLSLAITSFYGLSVAAYIFNAFAMMSLMTLFFYGFAAFVAMLTGHILVLPLVYGVLNFTVAGVVFMVYAILEKFVYGMLTYLSEDSPLLLFSPIIYILGKTRIRFPFDINGYDFRSYYYDGWGYLIAIAVAGLVFTGLAMALVRRRRMEAAGDVVAVNPLKPVFKYCLTFGSSIVLGIGLYSIVFEEFFFRSSSGGNALMILLFMLLGAFIGYFAADMMMKKTLRVFSGKSWRGLAAVAIILAAFTAVGEFDLTGFERRVPEASEVESAVVYGFGPMSFVENQEDIQALLDIHKSLVEHKSEHENRSSTGYNTNFFTNFFVDYSMKDGSMLSRRYYINTDVVPDIKAVMDFLNRPEMILARATPNTENLSAKNISEAFVSLFSEKNGYYTNAPLSSEDAFELYTECILPDIKDGTLGFIDMGWLEMGDGVEFMNCDVVIYFFERAANGEYSNAGSYSFTPTNKSLRTNAWLAEHGFEIKPYVEPVYYQ